jgi:predicted N-acetyltransferase YhbS
VVQDAQAFGDSTANVSVDRSLTRTPVEELRVLEEDGVNVGLLLARFHRVFWGGRPLPASQVSGLSIGAEHRGRGAGGELLRAYLEEAHDRGASVCTLFPATVPLYRRAGYEYAGTWTLYGGEARHLPLAWPTAPGPGSATTRPRCRSASPASRPCATARSSETRSGGYRTCWPTAAQGLRRCS